MRALTFTQPWATLVALGAKRYETRSWKPPFGSVGQPLAIHAAKGLGPVGGVSGLDRIFWSEPFYGALVRDGGFQSARELPRGAVVAVVDLVAVERAVTVGHRFEDAGDKRELAFGGYAGARWAWRLENVRPLGIPLEVGGALGLWEVAGVCRGCGCTDVLACDEGCWWIEPDLCSSCQPVTKEVVHARA